MAAAQITVTVRARVAWWVRPAIGALTTWARVRGRRADVLRLTRAARAIVRRGVRVTVA